MNGLAIASLLAVLAQDSRGSLGPALDDAVRRGAAWLCDHQQPDGSFVRAESGPLPALALTAISLWALAESSSVPGLEASCARAARRLLDHQQPDGGIYQPGGGLPHLTSAVALRALERWWSDEPMAVERDALARLQGFVAAHAEPESIDEIGRSTAHGPTIAGDSILSGEHTLPERLAGAVGFLKRIAPGERHAAPITPPAQDELTYSELMQALTAEGEPDEEWLARAHRAIQARYDPTRNPGLARPQLFRDPARSQDGLYYSHLVVARTLRAVGRPELVDSRGERHLWADEIGRRLIALQNADGSWVNPSPRWGEADRVLVTAYGLLILDACRGMEEVR